MKQHFDLEQVFKKINEEYCIFKEAKGIDFAYTAPEALPRVTSDQVKAVIQIFTDMMNQLITEINRKADRV